VSPTKRKTPPGRGGAGGGNELRDSTAPIDRVLGALRAHGCAPRRSGDGWSAKCPAHDDRNPSLSIRVGDDGRALLACHAGCTLAAVIGALGLRERDLFVETEPSRRNGRAAPRPTWPTLDAALADQRPNAHWVYRDAEGEPVGAAMRFEHADGKKVLPLSRDGGGAWSMRAMPEPRPLYALPELIASPGETVFIVEGEKCAEALRACGLIATTSVGGSKAVAKAEWSPLRGRSVVILPDHDDAGEQYANDVARLATAAGARSIRMARIAEAWPKCPSGGDIADALGEDGPWGGFEDADVRARIEAMSRPWEDDAETPKPAMAWAPFPTGALPSAAADLVRKGADAMQIDEGMLGPPMLAAMSAAIGNARVAELSRSWREPAILWAVVVAPSGTGKSPALDMAVRPAERRDGEAFRAYERERKEHASAMAIHKRETSAWERGSAKGGMADFPPEAPEPPVCQRFVTNDSTFEALASMLAASPRGMLLSCDELASWLGGFTRYAGGNGRPASEAARWLPMHRAGALKVDRKTSPPLRIERAALNIAGLIQPGVLASALTATDYDSGLVARLLLSMPPTPTRRWKSGGLSPMVEGAYASMVDRLYTLDMLKDEHGEPEPRALTLDDEAGRVWACYYNALNAEMAGQDERTRAMLSKLEGGAARLALVVHLGRVAGGEDADPDRIDGDSMRRGVALAMWFRREGERVYDRLGESEGDAERRALADWIRSRGPEGVTVWELARSGPRQYRGDAEAAKSALDALPNGRWIHPPPRGGRPPAPRLMLDTKSPFVDMDTLDTDTESTVSTPLEGLSVSVSSVSSPEPDPLFPPPEEVGGGPVNYWMAGG